MSEAPWTFGDAVEKCREASRAQGTVEEELANAYRKAAEAEEAYRMALAKEIVRVHAADGVAWSVAADVARGADRVAQLRRERDIADGVREALVQAAWRRAADRKDAQRFSDWSQRREFAEAAGHIPEPADLPVIGGRHAA